MGLELMALLGSKEAEKRLKTADEQNYDGYKNAASNAEKLLTNSSGMASEHINIIQYWLTSGGKVQSDENRRLNTCLSFWTYTRYISILYAKQSYTMTGKGFKIPPERTAAWLEPAQELYSSLEKQTVLLLSRIRKFKRDTDNTEKRLEDFQKILNKCQNIAAIENQKKAIDKPEIDFLNNLDDQLLKLVGEKDLPIIVDVHTEPTGGNVLEEGIGYPKSVEKSIGKGKAMGALFTYYENSNIP